MALAADGSVTAVVLVCAFAGLLFAAINTYYTSLIKINGRTHKHDHLLQEEHSHSEASDDVHRKIFQISSAIARGANGFLYKEYQYLAVFIVVFSIILLLVIGLVNNWMSALFTMIAFVTGALTSVLSGFLGMRIAVYSNSRTAISAQEGWHPAFATAFRAGSVMGFALTALGVLCLYVIINAFNLYWTDAFTNIDHTRAMYEAIAGYGLGGSSIALFARVGGGIFTKAADVGADLVGKLEHGMAEDDPRNPAVIADNVGDNVGDIAGMGADLFGSFAESSCAVMVISSQSPDLFSKWPSMCFPLVLISVGILVCIATSFVATHMFKIKEEANIEAALKRQLLVSTLLMTPIVYALTWAFLPQSFVVSKLVVKDWYIFFCVSCGLWSGLAIGYITEYFTSNRRAPVIEVARACETGAATNIIYGLALGYKSAVLPVFCLAITIYVSFSLAGMYGVACAALGILSTMSTCLTIDAYGPICDNAGGIAEMAGMGPEIRKKTDALDAAGNTTAAIGKGFAIGSAAMVALALFGAFVTVVNLDSVNILEPFQFAGLLVGAMLPYWFSAMTMKSVGKAAWAMVQEVRRQFREIPGLIDGTGEPQYELCVAISTEGALKEMIAPGALVMLTPLLVGFLLGVQCLAGLLAGILVSGVQMAISSSNTGGAWDNAKKYIEGGNLGEGKGKGSEQHKAAVVGDTVGDPLKDTSGPSLNILIKLSAILSLVFATSFPSVAKGGLLVQLFK